LPVCGLLLLPVLLISSVRKSVDFREKVGLYAAWIPRRGKPMGGGLPADCGRKNRASSTPFGTVTVLE